MTDHFVSSNGNPCETSPSLLDRAKQNDSDAWRLLVELYAPVAYTRCRKRWHLSPQDAEQVGQDVFVAVARKLIDFERKRSGSFRAWLRTIADNKCKDYLARKEVAVAKGGSAAQIFLERVVGQTDDEQFAVEWELDEKAIVIQQAINAIENEYSERDLRIFWSIAVEDKHRQVVAEEMNVSDNVVYLAYSRIKNRLREVYRELIDDDLL